jgi:hypothetical protein
MEKSSQPPKDHATKSSLQQTTCCGGKPRPDKAPQDSGEISMVIDPVSAPVQGSSGCCCGHR